MVKNNIKSFSIADIKVALKAMGIEYEEISTSKSVKIILVKGRDICFFLGKHPTKCLPECYSQAKLICVRKPIAIQRFLNLIESNYDVDKLKSIVGIEREKQGRIESSPENSKMGHLMKNYAEALIKNATNAEKLFKQDLDDAKVKYEFQKPIGHFIADFVLYDKIVVEIDGGYHNNIQQKYTDEVKTTLLNKAGYCVVRITNEQVENEDYPELINRILGY